MKKHRKHNEKQYKIMKNKAKPMKNYEKHLKAMEIHNCKMSWPPFFVGFMLLLGPAHFTIPQGPGPWGMENELAAIKT